MGENMSENIFGDLSVISMRGGEEFAGNVDYYLKQWRGTDESFVINADCPRFGTGEAKCLLKHSMRGHDVFIIADVFNYGVTYKMYDMVVPMSPDDHFQDIKRVIGAIAGKARRLSVIIPMLYEGRQHKRSARESLDCAVALQELVNMGVTNIITFDAHDPRVQNAIPNNGFDSVQSTYQMIKALVKAVPDIQLDKEHVMMIAPDEGAMQRSMYYASVIGLDLGMFYKRRDYTRVVDGRNPIEAHEYLGKSVKGKDVIVVDDMISSGDSMLDVAAQLKAKGAKRIFVFSTFGLFCNGFDMFDKAYEEGMITKVFTTNLNYRKPELLEKPWYFEVNMCKYVAMLVDTLNHDATISELLNPVNRIHNLLDKIANEKK
ncbi:MAG: ribose-phosphate pyrophosphokinase [Clostridia bacterium]|nr:ribose-phosphate pyrophosphokinase [Clostridia bacterium]